MKKIYSQKKRYKSYHWDCIFSKDTLLYPKAAYWYLLWNILAPKMYIFAPEMY